MAYRYLVIRSNGTLRRVMRIGISPKGEIYISPVKPGGQIKLFNGSTTFQGPKDQNSKWDVDFTKYPHSHTTEYTGKFHIGYKSDGDSVAVIGPTKAVFTIPGLKELETPVELGQFYPARLALYPQTDIIGKHDVPMPDAGQLAGVEQAPFIQPQFNIFIDKNIENIFGQEAFSISLVAFPRNLLGKEISLPLGDNYLPGKVILVFINANRFSLGMIFQQATKIKGKGWSDYELYMNHRIALTSESDDLISFRGDVRIVEHHFHTE